MLRKGCSSPELSRVYTAWLWLQNLASSTKVAPQGRPSQVPHVPTKAVAILGVEASAVDEVDAAPNHISCSECGTIGLASPRGAEGMPIITMVTIGMFIPTCGGKESKSLGEVLERTRQRSPLSLSSSFQHLTSTPGL